MFLNANHCQMINYENMKQTGRTSKCKFGIFEEQHIGGQNDILICVDRKLEHNEQVCCLAQGQDYGCFEVSRVLPSDNVGRLG